MDTFIGRLSERQRIFEDSKQIDRGLVWDIVGVHGVGKSKLLERVCEEAQNLPTRSTVHEVDLGPQRGLDEGYRGDYGPNASAGVLWLTFLRSRDLMLDSADHFGQSGVSEAFDDFKIVCEDQYHQANAYIGNHDLRSRGDLADRPSVAEQAITTRLRDFQKALDDAFVEAWDEFTRRHGPVLLSLDSFENIAAYELGQWLVRLALRLPKTLTMVARTPLDIDLGGGSSRYRRVELSYFTLEEVELFLQKRLSSQSLQPGIGQAIYDYTDGHPGGTDLGARLFIEKGADLDARSLRRVLNRLPEDPQARWGEIVHLIVDVVQDPELRAAVDVAPISLTFDEPLLAALLNRSPEQGAGDAIAALRAHHLAQPARGDVRGERLRLVEFVRRSLAERIRVNHPTRWKALHATAAQHYFTLLERDESEDPVGPYGQWYRYERPAWQANKQDWIYHSGQVLERRELTRSRFLLVFLEAFWWWGCYENFPFNQRLIEDWERAASTSGRSAASVGAEDQQLADALWFLLENYPLGYVKQSAAWQEVESRLRLVRRLCGVAPGNPLPPDDEERGQMLRTRGMIAIFLAHTRRFRDPRDSGADRYYGEALQIFQKLEDQWVLAWLKFEVADLALERQEPETAVSCLAESARFLRETLATGAVDDSRAEESGGDDLEGLTASAAKLDDDFGVADEAAGSWDYELLANLHRARGDAHWMRGELEPAATAYGRAVTYAYWFQRMPRPPDPYTVRFYGELTTRTAERIVTLAGQDRTEALKFAEAIRTELPNRPSGANAELAVDLAGVDGVARALFPAGPDPATELLQDDSPFMDVWGELWDEHRYPDDEILRVVEILQTT